MIQLPMIPPMSIRWESIWAKISVTHWTQLHFFLFLNTAIFTLLDLKLLNHKVLQEIKTQHSHTLTEQNRMIFLCIPIMRCCVYRWSTERDWFGARRGVDWHYLLSFPGTNDSRSRLVLNTELVLSYWERNVVKPEEQVADLLQVCGTAWGALERPTRSQTWFYRGLFTAF